MPVRIRCQGSSQQAGEQHDARGQLLLFLELAQGRVRLPRTWAHQTQRAQQPPAPPRGQHPHKPRAHVAVRQVRQVLIQLIAPLHCTVEKVLSGIVEY